MSDFNNISNYWLSPSGELRGRDPVNGESDSHADIGLRVLAELGVQARDRDDVYGQLFQRGYLRLNQIIDPVCGDEVYADNNGSRPTDVQRAVLLFRESQGFRITLNSKAYESTRDGAENARQDVRRIIS